jgi:hypothetical protein
VPEPTFHHNHSTIFFTSSIIKLPPQNRYPTFPDFPITALGHFEVSRFVTDNDAGEN